MATYSPQRPDITGKNPTFSAVASTDKIKYTDDSSFIIVKNGSGGSINATVVVPGAKYGQANPDVVVAVPAGAERWIGPFKRDMCDENGEISINYSATTTVTAALVTL